MNPFLNYKNFTKSIFRGIGQVMLQKNAITGLLFLIGIFYASWLMGIGALMGVFVGTITALILKYEEKDILNGIYGFNGTLVGIALLFFFKPTILLFLLLIIAVIVSTIVMHFMYKNNLSPYTFPFVITTWVFIFLIKILNITPAAISGVLNFTNIDIFSGISLGFSQVMFQASIITGILFFIAILINSRIAAIYALVGSTIGLLTGLLFFPSSINLINLGIFGFNGVLCGIAFSDKKWIYSIFAIISIILSVGIVYGFITLNLIALTAPFVFASWITMFAKNKIQKT